MYIDEFVFALFTAMRHKIFTTAVALYVLVSMILLGTYPVAVENVVWVYLMTATLLIAVFMGYSVGSRSRHLTVASKISVIMLLGVVLFFSSVELRLVGLTNEMPVFASAARYAEIISVAVTLPCVIFFGYQLLVGKRKDR